MAGRLFANRLRPVIQIQRCGLLTVDRIGNREVVGYGYNGEPTYLDRVDFPCPAIRWKENTSDVMVRKEDDSEIIFYKSLFGYNCQTAMCSFFFCQALREKEKGDWKKLSIEEKKALYRASFRQTFSEMEAPTGEWKGIIGLSCILISTGIWLYLYFKVFGMFLF